jgi:hypothetical protein
MPMTVSPDALLLAKGNLLRPQPSHIRGYAYPSH